MKGLRIEAVEPSSTAARAGLRAGDILTSINGDPVRDIIDFYFLLATGKPRLFIRRGAKDFAVLIDDTAGEIGLRFSRPFGVIRRCINHCLFCFIDQQPPGMRSSLHFKDDDYRLSFWEGNFITLTNCTRPDMERIAAQRISPLYVSVHTTNPELRAKMMGNRRAAKIYEQLRFLARAGITLHTQVVLCPGLNDGDELSRTVNDLAELYPSIRSVAVVPVGLTRFREGLYPLRPVSPGEAAQIIGFVEQKQKEFQHRWGSRIVFAADEFYLLAGKSFPPAKQYEGFPQLENGVGLVRRFVDAWRRAEKRLPPSAAQTRAIVVTGILAETVLRPAINRLNLVQGLQIELLPVENRLFGPCVTVAGLLSGKDIQRALEGREKPDIAIIPAVALNEQGLLLDGVSVGEVAAAAGCPVVPANSPWDLLKALGIRLQR